MNYNIIISICALILIIFIIKFKSNNKYIILKNKQISINNKPSKQELQKERLEEFQNFENQYYQNSINYLDNKNNTNYDSIVNLYLNNKNKNKHNNSITGLDYGNYYPINNNLVESFDNPKCESLSLKQTEIPCSGELLTNNNHTVKCESCSSFTNTNMPIINNYQESEYPNNYQESKCPDNYQESEDIYVRNIDSNNLIKEEIY